jgi:hypothetical protein
LNPISSLVGAKIRSNVRELEGALGGVVAKSTGVIGANASGKTSGRGRESKSLPRLLKQYRESNQSMCSLPLTRASC